MLILPASGSGPSFDRSFERTDLGTVIPLSFIVGRTATVALGVGGFIAYRNSLVFTVLISVRNASDELTPWRAYRALAERHDTSAARESGGLSIELAFANGANAASIESIAETWPPTQEHPIVITQSARGSSGWWEMECIVVPLPPPGPLTFTCRWGETGVLFRHTIDATPIVDAATSSLELW